jgi:hypothetical protein
MSNLNIIYGFLLILFNFSGITQTWSPVGGGTNGNIRALEKHNNKLYIGGSFSTAGSISSNNIASWDGLIWDSLGSGFSSVGSVACLHSTFNGLFVGGSFNTVGNLQSSSGGGIALWENSNWYWVGGGVVSFSPYNPGSVNSISFYNNQLYIGGRFLTAGGSTIPNIAKWNGSFWSGLTSATTQSVVLAMAEYNNELYVGGSFTSAGGVTANHIAKWNGTSWSIIGSGANDIVYCFLVYNGQLYVGGNFSNINGISANKIAKWNGTNWAPVGSGTNDNVYALAVYNGELYAGGSFTQAGGNPAKHIAKWDGANWLPLGIGTDTSVYALTAYQGDLYVGGMFTSAGGSPTNYIAKWNNPIGIKDLEINYQINVYPNPATDKIWIEQNKKDIKIEEIVLIDAYGTEHKTFMKNKNEVDISTLNSGVYILILNTNKGLLRKKFIISR